MYKQYHLTQRVGSWVELVQRCGRQMGRGAFVAVVLLRTLSKLISQSLITSVLVWHHRFLVEIREVVAVRAKEFN